MAADLRHNIKALDRICKDFFDGSGSTVDVEAGHRVTSAGKKDA
jgi:hypothetical protein